MPTSPLKKRPSGGGGGGRLRRLLASLRPPARPGPLPVQTGFPTSLADIVVKNHGRFKIPRRRRRAAAAEPTTPVPQSQQERRELSAAQDAAAPAPVTGFSIWPGVLAAGGAVALVLLVIWSKQLVAAATLASVALFWIESVRGPRPETEVVVVVDLLPTIREAAESATWPRHAECVSGSADADSGDLGRDDDDDDSSSSSSVKRKQRRRSLRKLLTKKLLTGRTPRGTDSRNGGDAGEHEHELPERPRRFNAEDAAAPAEERLTPARPPEAITDDERCRRRHCRRGGALPLPALVPIILAGLVAGKLPALALAVLFAAFSTSSVERVPFPAGQASR